MFSISLDFNFVHQFTLWTFDTSSRVSQGGFNQSTEVNVRGLFFQTSFFTLHVHDENHFLLSYYCQLYITSDIPSPGVEPTAVGHIHR
jgi:hypothetical protein